MSTSINGTNGVTFADASVLGSSQGLFNRVIDGGFIINQRGYVSGTSLSSGSYGHDRWKAGASGCTYTFTQGSLGVNTAITITAGSLQQVIEGCNMAEGGTYVLTWTGTAQARFNSGSYSSSPLKVTGITAGANTTIEFNTGTVGSVGVFSGSAPTTFPYRPYGTELQLCQRYYQMSYPQGSVPGSNTSTGTRCLSILDSSVLTRQFFLSAGLPVVMRTAPTMSFWTNTGTANSTSAYSSGTVMTITGLSALIGDASVGSFVTTTTNGTAYVPYYVQFTASSEL